MSLSRRRFVQGLAATTGSLGLGSKVQAFGGQVPAELPLIVSTHPFGRRGNEVSLKVLQDGGSVLDAVEQGVREVEARGNDRSVGLRGRPNAAGVVQLDACIMNGPGHQAGSVAAIEGIVHPITAARRVMEHTKHVMLVGKGARWFALEQGLESVDVSGHPELEERWRRRDEEDEAPEAAPGDDDGPPSHDTVALLAFDGQDVAGGCSTSGAGNKLPGRVGDSPIIGSGLYVDNQVGAAGGTGLGENAMRHCAAFLVVELMRQGRDPATACAEALHRMAAMDPLGYELSLSFCALDRQGRWGGATTGGFQVSVTTPEQSASHPAPKVGPR